MENLEKVAARKNLTKVVTDGVKIEEMVGNQNEQTLCKSIIKGLARSSQERPRNVGRDGRRKSRRSYASMTSLGKSCHGTQCRKAREQDLKYLRDLGVYEKIDEREATARYQVTPVDTKWIDTDKAFEGKPMQIRSRLVPREFQE